MRNDYNLKIKVKANTMWIALGVRMHFDNACKRHDSSISISFEQNIRIFLETR